MVIGFTCQVSSFSFQWNFKKQCNQSQKRAKMLNLDNMRTVAFQWFGYFSLIKYKLMLYLKRT